MTVTKDEPSAFPEPTHTRVGNGFSVCGLTMGHSPLLRFSRHWYGLAGPRVCPGWFLIFAFLFSDALLAATLVLETATEVRMLTEHEASEAIPVVLNGVFMGDADPGGIAFILQDATAGIYIQAPAEQLRGICRGDLLQVKGVSNPGGFAPIVLANSVKKMGKGTIPPPLQVSVDELYEGQLDAQWVEFSGVVRSVEPKVQSDASPPPPGTLYELPDDTPDASLSKYKLKLVSGLARVMVEVYGPIDPSAYVDAEVRLRGLCFNLHNRNRQYVKPFVQVPQGEPIMVEKAPGRIDFEGEPVPISRILRFSPQAEGNDRRVLLRGVVVYHRPGVGLWIRDGEDCLRIESKQEGVLRPGDVVDVLGFPVPGEYSSVLEDATFRIRTRGEFPHPTPIASVSDALHRDSDLVQLDALLMEVWPVHGGLELTLDWAGHAVRANLYQYSDNAIPEDWRPGSLVRVAGVCAVQTDEAGPLGGLWIPNSFQLLLRSTGDVVVTQPPPWWSAERIVWVLVVFLGLALLAIALVVWASRQRMKEQEYRRAMAEAEFSAILKERNRVAREIHDTLSQSLGSISMQLELARTHADDLDDQMRGYLGTAHKLTREALAEARSSIWNMRSHVLEKGDLGYALGRILDQLTQDSGVRATVNIRGDRRRLSPVIENNLLRIGQEAITNAVKHANARSVELSLSFEQRRVCLSVSDDGVGFCEGAEPSVQGHGFGLVGIRERVALIGGSVDIRSSPGHGTAVMVRVAA